ncbi:class I tRNA ligase family protein [Candidatus Vidania fulgoroideorum]
MKINIFYTNFSMKANLFFLQKKINKFWKKNEIYKSIIRDKKRKKFILHDGPPYANGKVHFGHLLNKIIKDVIMKKKNMYGYRTIYLPGWDCHGTPIELKVSKKKEMILYRKYAINQIKKQKRVFKKIGMIYDWKNYYKTMSYDIESREVKLFIEFYKKKKINRNKKIVNWCYKCNSSLSEFEIEKKNIECNYFLISFNLCGNILFFAAKHNNLNYKVIGVSVNHNEKILILKNNKKFFFIIKSQYFIFKKYKIYKEIDLRIIKKNKNIIIDKNKTEVLYSIKKRYLKNKIIFFKKKIKSDVCWRHKIIIYRTVLTHWFIKTDFDNKFYKKIKKIKFYPKNTKNIFKKYLMDRPDWNIARQRKWGVPICLIYNKKNNKIYLLKGIYELIKKYGIEIWSKIKLSKEYKKSKDTLDVWFDSGISHYTVLKNKKLCKYNKSPADVYVEGVDQHRGWFNASTITSYLYNNKICSKSFVTHGFVVDEKGKKMSKSLGNYLDVEKILKNQSIEIIRMYLMSMNYFKNIQFSINELKKIEELYKKIRYIIRFMLNNSKDLKFINKKKICYEETDKYIINEFVKLFKKVKKFDKKYEYFNSFKCIKEFCIKKLSNFYFELIKDRLYLSKKNSKTRITCQYVLKKILKKILILLSPYISYTCEEAWLINNKKSIFFEKIKNFKKIKSINNWKEILNIRKKVLKNKINYKEKAIRLYFYIKYIKLKKIELNKIFKVSDVKILKRKSSRIILEPLYNYKKCERCWNYYKKIKKFCNDCKNILKNEK